ncbi:MAG: hypothetical protein JST48_10655 [Bacteroidetes bacterium]|nr:hypothetical protein [Bacteroidota bacterium]
MKIIVYLPNKEIKEIFPNGAIKVGELIKLVSPQTANLADNLEDQEVYLLDKPDELSKDSKTDDHKAFVIHRCKKVQVTVIYSNKSFTHAYPPSTLIKHIRLEAIKKFEIDGPAGENLELFENGENQNSKVNRNYPIGYYSDYPTCSIKLYLADPNAFAG